MVIAITPGPDGFGTPLAGTSGKHAQQRGDITLRLQQCNEFKKWRVSEKKILNRRG